MSDRPFIIRDAVPRDLPRVRELLALADLPTEGVEAADLLLVADFGGAVEGCAGLEHRGSDALLRSVAVSETRRGSAVGTALVAAMLDRARSSGVEEVYLLTTTARSFFERFGFVALPRERAPEVIAATSEFRVLCPGTATLMARAVESAPESGTTSAD